MTHLEKIGDQLKRAIHGNAWHGPSVLEALNGLSAKQAATRPIKQAHSPWEITLHITAWLRIMVRRFEGEDPEITRELDWPAIAETTEQAWSEAIKDLKKAHKQFQRVIDNTSESELYVKLPTQESDLYFFFHGLIQHCIYHAGQIAILKKSFS